MAAPSSSPSGDRTAPGRRPDRRSWLSHGVAALAISALGLAAAGSLASISSADSTTGPTPVTTVALDPVQPLDPAPQPSSPALSAFARPVATSTPPRSASLQAAVNRELAAQRAEDLAKTAEKVTRVDRTEAGAARQRDLSAAEQDRQVASAALAAENLRRAVAARLAAAAARAVAEQQTTAAATNAAAASGEPVTTTDSPAAVPSGRGAFAPIASAIIGSHFHEYGSWSSYHTGLDFRAAYGTPIRSAKAGVVLYAGQSGDWAGKHVAVRHADGTTTMYSHMSRMMVGAGQTVRSGQVLGQVGQTGRAFGAHLHFEVYPVGVRFGDVYRAIDPERWLHDNGVRTR